MTGRTFSASEAKQALLMAGHELLEERTSVGGIGSVSLASAISRSGVPRASAYRVFGPSSAQDEFQMQLLIEVTSGGPGLDLAVLDRVADEVAAEVNVDASREELTEVLAALIRNSSAHLVGEQFSNSRTGVYLAALASTVHSEPTGELRVALRNAELAVVDCMTDFVRRVTDIFGLRMRPGLSHLDLSAAITSAISGAYMTSQVGPAENIEIIVGTDSGELGWTRLGVTLLGIVAMSTAPNPRRRNTADPSAWFGADN